MHSCLYESHRYQSKTLHSTWICLQSSGLGDSQHLGRCGFNYSFELFAAFLDEIFRVHLLCVEKLLICDHSIAFGKLEIELKRGSVMVGQLSLRTYIFNQILQSEKVIGAIVRPAVEHEEID